jgi:hypothetical protein
MEVAVFIGILLDKWFKNHHQRTKFSCHTISIAEPGTFTFCRSGTGTGTEMASTTHLRQQLDKFRSTKIQRCQI